MPASSATRRNGTTCKRRRPKLTKAAAGREASAACETGDGGLTGCPRSREPCQSAARPRAWAVGLAGDGDRRLGSTSRPAPGPRPLCPSPGRSPRSPSRGTGSAPPRGRRPWPPWHGSRTVRPGAGSVVNRCGSGWSAVADAPSAPPSRRNHPVIPGPSPTRFTVFADDRDRLPARSEPPVPEDRAAQPPRVGVRRVRHPGANPLLYLSPASPSPPASGHADRANGCGSAARSPPAADDARQAAARTPGTSPASTSPPRGSSPGAATDADAPGMQPDGPATPRAGTGRRRTARGESPGGIAPPGARRTVRERLRSYSSHHPAAGVSPSRCQWANSRGSRRARPPSQ